jgi:glucan phosphoethanolaminetransferase (alkaline phosphatase superfamily)
MNERAIIMKKKIMYYIPIAMIILNSFFSVKYNINYPIVSLFIYLLWYLTFVLYFVFLVFILLNQHKLIEHQKWFIDIAFGLWLLNIFLFFSSIIIFNFMDLK